MNDKEKSIASIYKEMWETAVAITEEDVLLYPLDQFFYGTKSKGLGQLFCNPVSEGIERTEKQRSRTEKHLLGMLSLQQSRDSDNSEIEILQVFKYLGKQISDAMLNDIPITKEMWDSWIASALTGRYKEEENEVQKDTVHKP